MLVLEFMHRDLFCLDPHTSCDEARRELKKRGIRRAPVVQGEKLVGIVSLLDLVRRGGGRAENPRVSEAMSSHLLTVASTDHLEKAARIMCERKVGGLPVVDHDELVGIITESDIFKALISMISRDRGTRILFEIPPEAGGDLSEYIWLCMKNQCKINGLLTHPRSLGGTLVFLGLQDGRIDDLVSDLWRCATSVIEVQRAEPELQLNP